MDHLLFIQPAIQVESDKKSTFERGTSYLE